MTTSARRLSARLILFAVVASFLVTVAGRADAGPDNPAADEAQFVALVNQARANVGAAPLKVDAQLTALGRQHTQEMADAGHIYHANPISAGVTSPWIKLGENVGSGPSVQPVMTAFINSPAHYTNIIDPAFTYIGVGVIWVGNQMFTTHRFMQLSGSTAPPTTAASAPPAAPAEPAPPVTTRAPSSAPPPTAPPATAPPVTVPAFQPTSATPERVATVLIALRAVGL